MRDLLAEHSLRRSSRRLDAKPTHCESEIRARDVGARHDSDGVKLMKLTVAMPSGFCGKSVGMAGWRSGWRKGFVFVPLHARSVKFPTLQEMTDMSAVPLGRIIQREVDVHRNQPYSPAAWQIDTRVPGYAAATVTLASSCFEIAATMPVPRPGLALNRPVGMPTPSSRTESVHASFSDR